MADLTRLLVDARAVCHPTARDRGIGRYTLGLLRGLHDVGAPAVGLYSTEEEAVTVGSRVPGITLEPLHPQTLRRHAVDGAWYLATQLMLHPLPLDPVPAIVTRAGVPVAAVMYDVTPERHPQRYQVRPQARAQVVLRGMLARTLDALLAISDFAANTAADELRFPRERVATIGAGFEPGFSPPADDPWPRLARVLAPSPRETVVAVVGGDERKNVERLIQAWGRLPRSTRDRHRLALAGAGDPAVIDRWREWATAARLTDQEWLATGAVNDEEMIALHQAAVLAVMPSTEEGFGLPVLEAAACGIPVITSSVSSLPEVLDHRAAQFDPFDTDSISAAIDRALTDETHRSDLLAAAARAAARWTWEAAARKTVAALCRIEPRLPSRPRPLPVSIAVAGAFDDSQSGRALTALTDALRGADEGYSVHLLVDTSATVEPTRGGQGRSPVRAAGRSLPLSQFDHVVAWPSPGTSGTAALAQWPGVHTMPAEFLDLDPVSGARRLVAWLTSTR
jgi:glycosyltransferase involved in cell wall biosynthesis